MKTSLLALALCLCPAVASAGDIRAIVRDAAGKPVADAVVIASPSDGAAGTATKAPLPTIHDQVNKEFVPYVLSILVGTPVSFPNNDDIRHHVYSFSPAKPFELPLYSGTPASPIVFDKPGVVVLGCNIHDWMVAYIYVSESRFFAKTGADGRATVSGLPAGEYTVRVWHPLLEGSEQATARPLGVPASGTVETTRELRLTPDYRPRRAPVPGRGGY